MKAKDCVYYRPPRYIIDPATDEGYETGAVCELVDKYCLLEHGDKCCCYLEEE